MGIVEAAKQALAQKDLKRLDDLWTEMVLDETVQLDDLFALTADLKKSNESRRAFMFLEMLATHLESRKEYRKAIDVYKKMVYHTKDTTKIRAKLCDLYKYVYAQSEHLNEYIEISGLMNADSIFKALEKLDEFLTYDKGQYFYFERYGIGEVTDVLPSKKEIVIDFEKKRRHFLSINVARGLLTSIPETHYLYLKHKDVETLKEMAEKNPIELIKLMLQSFDEPLTAATIKEHLNGIVDKQHLTKFWEKARKELKKEHDIKISGRTQKTYTYHPSEFDKTEIEITAFQKASEMEKYLLAEAYAKKMPAVFGKVIPRLVEIGNKVYEKKPALALDILMLCDDVQADAQFSYTKGSILEQTSIEQIVLNLNSLEHQKRLLREIKEKNQKEWPEIFKKLLFTAADAKLLNAIEEHLRAVPETLKDVYYTIFSLPKHYPQQFQWILQKMQTGDLQEYLNISFIPRLIESLNYVKGTKAMVSRILSLDSFDSIIKDAAEDDARRILDTINSSTVLEYYKKKDLLKIIEFHFPHLFTRECEVIYTTEAGLESKKKELNRIITIEIPENKKEISHAREFGDLSENFEYKAAKERQEQLYQKLRNLESELAKVRLIDPSQVNTKHVDIGTKITLQNLQDDTVTHYTILGRWDTDLDKNIISNEAPLARSLLKKARGDEVTIDNVLYVIIEIEKGI